MKQLLIPWFLYIVGNGNKIKAKVMIFLFYLEDHKKERKISYMHFQ